eukprot:1205669-Amorphochlora_amoeboformis.AAC.1
MFMWSPISDTVTTASAIRLRPPWHEAIRHVYNRGVTQRDIVQLLLHNPGIIVEIPDNIFSIRGLLPGSPGLSPPFFPVPSLPSLPPPSGRLNSSKLGDRKAYPWLFFFSENFA